MKNNTFISLVVLSFGISIAGAATFRLFSNILPGDILLSMLICISSAVFSTVFLNTVKKSGKLLFHSMFFVGMAILSVIGISPFMLTLFSILMLWVSRCFFYHTNMLYMTADLGMSFLSIAMAYWAFIDTGSIFVIFWSYFLTQSLVLLLKQNQRINRRTVFNKHEAMSPFDHAYKQAEYAVRKATSRI